MTILHVWLACTFLIFGQSLASGQTVTPTKPFETTVSEHFDDSVPYSDQTKTIGNDIRLVLPEGYHFCKELKRNVTQEGAGVFGRMSSYDWGEWFGYTVTTDTQTHQTSRIAGDISISGVLDLSKADCPARSQPFPNFVTDSPSTVIAKEETLRHYLPAKVFSQHVSESHPYDPNLKPQYGTIWINIDPPYHACRVQTLSFNLTGLASLSRSGGSDNLVAYSYILSPDNIFKQPSGIEGDFGVVGVLGREKAKCEPYDVAFFPFFDVSPSSGWVSKYRYISSDHTAGWRTDTVTATAPPGYFYCTHKVDISNKNGTNQFYPSYWSATDFQLFYGVLSGMVLTGEHGASLGLTLYVKFVPDPSHDPSCTAPLVGHKPPGQPHQNGDEWYWTPN